MNNAYILVYQRKGWEGEQAPGGKAACTAEGATQSEDIVDEAEDRHEIVACPKVPVQKHLLETVWDTNRAFVRERHVYNDGFARFMWRLVNVHDPAVDEGTSQANTQAPCDTTSREVSVVGCEDVERSRSTNARSSSVQVA